MLHTLLVGYGQERRCSSEVVVCAYGTGVTVLQRSANSRPSSWVESLLNPQT